MWRTWHCHADAVRVSYCAVHGVWCSQRGITGDVCTDLQAFGQGTCGDESQKNPAYYCMVGAYADPSWCIAECAGLAACVACAYGKGASGTHSGECRLYATSSTLPKQWGEEKQDGYFLNTVTQVLGPPDEFTCFTKPQGAHPLPSLSGHLVACYSYAAFPYMRTTIPQTSLAGKTLGAIVQSA